MLRVHAELRKRLYGRLRLLGRGNPNVITLLNILGFGFAFSIAYYYAMTVGRLDGSPFWLPDSVLLCTLLLSRPSSWPIYLAATLPVRLMIAIAPDTPLWFLFAAFLNDSLKALLSAVFLRWAFAGRTIRFDRLREFWIYLTATALVTPAVSGIAGAAAWVVRGREFWPSWRNWFLGDALVNLVITPLFLCVALDWRTLTRAKPIRYLESLAIFSGLIVAVRFAYRWDQHSPGFVDPINYAPVAFMLLAAVRLGPMGASASLAIMSMLSIFAVSTSEQASAHPGRAGVLSLQLFLALIGVPIMSLSVLIEQQRKTEQSLRENEARLARLNAEQEQIMGEITALTERLVSAQEVERRRIGSELHDDVSQQVALLGIQLSHAKRIPTPGAAGQAAIATIENGLIRLAASIQALSHELHPAFFERTGIVPALRAHCEELKVVNGIRLHMSCEGIMNLASDLALGLYRVAQEALRNAVKHSGAKDVWVSLSTEGNRICLRVEDSGRGFDPEAVHTNGVGLTSIKDRVRIAGGTVNFEARPGGGAVVRVEVPLADLSLPRASIAAAGGRES